MTSIKGCFDWESIIFPSLSPLILFILQNTSPKQVSSTTDPISDTTQQLSTIRKVTKYLQHFNMFWKRTLVFSVLFVQIHLCNTAKALTVPQCLILAHTGWCMCTFGFALCGWHDSRDFLGRTCIWWEKNPKPAQMMIHWVWIVFIRKEQNPEAKESCFKRRFPHWMQTPAWIWQASCWQGQESCT